LEEQEFEFALQAEHAALTVPRYAKAIRDELYDAVGSWMRSRSPPSPVLY